VERFLLALILKRPFRCDTCKARFYGYTYAQQLSAPLPAAGPDRPDKPANSKA
jgi:hypothetical protein